MQIARGLLASAVPVMALHAVALGVVSDTREGAGGTPAGRPLIVRIEAVQAAVAPTMTEVAEPLQPVPAENTKKAAWIVAAEPPAPSTPDPLPADPADPAAAIDSATVAAAERRPAGDEAAAPLDFLPRDKLSVPPRPIGFVDVPFPAEVTEQIDLAVQLTLFIDEQGVVQRVRLDGPDVGPVLQEAARSSFMNARFSPGELNGRAVRSQMRVEVTFRSEAPPAGTEPPR